MPKLFVRASSAKAATIAVVLAFAASAGLAQTTPAPQQEGQAATPAGSSTYEMQLKEDNELYILDDVEKPETVPKVDLGKVGKRGELSLERMRIDGEEPPDTRPRGAGGLRLRVPLGKQAQ